jgi:hypothetical protein
MTTHGGSICGKIKELAAMVSQYGIYHADTTVPRDIPVIMNHQMHTRKPPASAVQIFRSHYHARKILLYPRTMMI